MNIDHVKQAAEQFIRQCRNEGLLTIPHERVFGYTVVVHTTQTSSTRVQFTQSGPSFALDQAPDHIYKRAWQCWREELARCETATGAA